ncbi:hypothetical protein L484_004729 [Morus notabilis]|uniref:Uncharacterized protein n=1 Tax=Morus notabilis TaxID=981085 RepID=W9S4I0_9ROSA|nr:hypothetical protein L484_004729 [Morus notabilis]
MEAKVRGPVAVGLKLAMPLVIGKTHSIEVAFLEHEQQNYEDYDLRLNSNPHSKEDDDAVLPKRLAIG